MARTKGARDRTKRKRRGPGVTERRLKNLELATRSVGNLSRGVNALTRVVEQGRITAKYLGYVPERVAKANRLKNNLALVNSGAKAGNSVLRLRTGILGIGKVQQGLGKLRTSTEQGGSIARGLGRLFL